MNDSFELAEVQTANSFNAESQSRLVADAYASKPIENKVQHLSQKERLDNEYLNGLTGAYSTPQMVDCANQFRDKWDKILNSAYKSTQANVSPEQKQALLNAQRQWLRFRDADFESLDSVRGDFRFGSIATYYGAELKKDLVQLRAIEIQNRGGDEQNGSAVDRRLESGNAIDEKLAKPDRLFIDQLGEAYDDWDAELNKNYKELMNSELSQEQKETFRQAQREWIKFRDQEFTLIDSLYDHRYSGNRISALEDKVDIIRQRALQLKERKDTLLGG